MQTHPFFTTPRSLAAGRRPFRFLAIFGLALGSLLLLDSIGWGQDRSSERTVRRETRTDAVRGDARVDAVRGENPFVELPLDADDRVVERTIVERPVVVRPPARRVQPPREPIVYSYSSDDPDRETVFIRNGGGIVTTPPAMNARYLERDPRGSLGANDREFYTANGRRIEDQDFTPRGPFNYNRPRIRNVGRDRQQSDERYYDRMEYPDRYRGTLAPDYVEESAYIPDYRPEYRETQWRRAGAPLSVDARTDQIRREEAPLAVRGGGRLGRGPTGIADPEYMGAGGRDTAGRRRGVSGQSGAFGGRDRGTLITPPGVGYAPGDYGVRELYEVPLGELSEPLPPVVDRYEPLVPSAARVERVERVPRR
jgi:hypothetical protein